MHSKQEFEDWIRSVFDHPVLDPEWYFRASSDDDVPYPPPCTAADYMIRLFESPLVLLKHLSEGQIAHGLQYLLSNTASNYIFLLVDESVPKNVRIRLIRSFFFLFRDLFARICSDYCGGPDHPDRRPADFICFMMWDGAALPLYPDRPEHRELDKELLNVLKSTLALPSLPCRKSALHGLGHAHEDYPTEVESIIDEFLSKYTDINEDLREYALAAREGWVE